MTDDFALFKAILENDGLPDSDQPFTLTSRKPRDLFDQIRDPDNRAILKTLAVINRVWWRGNRIYRSYVYESKHNHIKFLDEYTTVSAAIAGHDRHCQALEAGTFLVKGVYHLHCFRL